MPRQPRLDAPGTLHHVMGRGIEASKVFRTPGVGIGKKTLIDPFLSPETGD